MSSSDVLIADVLFSNLNKTFFGSFDPNSDIGNSSFWVTKPISPLEKNHWKPRVLRSAIPSSDISVANVHSSKRPWFWRNGRPEPRPGDFRPQTGLLAVCGPKRTFPPEVIVHTVGPLIIESLRAKERVSTGALGALDDPLVVQTKI